jgi:hypothetical protein
MRVKYRQSYQPVLNWKSVDHTGKIWFESNYEFWHFKPIKNQENAKQDFVHQVLKSVRLQNPHFLRDDLDVFELEILHQEFVKRQIYKYDKTQADSIISSVQNKQEIPIAKLKLLQESYINGVLERMYNIEMPFKQLEYFSNTKEIINRQTSYSQRK